METIIEKNVSININTNGMSSSESISRWDVLLKDKREREKSFPPSEFDKRNPFENDYSRLISSAPIRRLQDKTQVFPLEKNDFIRTRLTHSLEVSSIARSIGKSVEKILIQEGLLDRNKDSYISSVLTNAGLIHDIGNPPFGHFGEQAIQDFFADLFSKIDRKDNDENDGNNKKNQLIKSWSRTKKLDFERFDGNVQTLRILTRLYFFGDANGYNLSYPTLSSVIKYPRSSEKGNKKKSEDICDKKFGYFISEEKLFNDINEELNLKGQRHPVTFLLEAADDIAYAAADIEDGIKLGKLSFETIMEIFRKESSMFSEQELEMLHYFENTYKGLTCSDSLKLDLAIQKFRVKTQTFMINSIIKEFFNNYHEIMSGKYMFELIDNSEAKNLRKTFRTISKIVYKGKGIIETELAGYKVIQGLLKEYIDACFDDKDFNSSNKGKNGRLYNTISSSYRYIFETYKENQTDDDLYNKFQLVIDFISGMTDTYALELYQRISGIRLK